MEDQSTKANVQAITKHTTAPGGVAQVYANVVDMTWTTHDLQFVFSHRHRASDETPTNVVEARGHVTVAWSQAKAMMLMMADIIDRYEKLNGPIQTARLP